MNVKFKRFFKRAKNIMFFVVTFIGSNLAIAAKASSKAVE